MTDKIQDRIRALIDITGLHDSDPELAGFLGTHADMIDHAENSLPQTLESELAGLLNRASWDARTDTPDFILAQFLVRTLESFKEAGKAARRWRDGEGQ